MAGVIYGQDIPAGVDIIPQAVIGEKEISEAIATLQEYKSAKASFESRIVDDELWWELRHWEAIKGDQNGPEPTSAWLFSAINGKHADAMDNYPTVVAMPRERSDEQSAKVLSEVLPVILDNTKFKKVYREAWWEKLKHGTAAYSVVWSAEKENGLGDVSITNVDVLKIFAEPGISNIQDSRNLFLVDLVDEDLLDDMYPDHAGKMKGSDIEVKQYIYDQSIDISKKVVVVDWYYKRNVEGKTVLHYAKFVGKELLYASENDPMLRSVGIYEHGMYPIVLDCLYPEKGTPFGFGLVSICKDPQMYIDKLDSNILESSMMGTKKRFFASTSTNVNVDDFLDWNKPIVCVDGEITENRLREITVSPISPAYVDIINRKVDEMKETSSSRDVNNGQAGSVTAAAAVSALQEAGNKTSRDMIDSSYDCYEEIVTMVLELVRQFYDEMRSFRITAPNGMEQYAYVAFNNSGIRNQLTGVDAIGNELYRKPLFDIKISAQKKNPFSRMEQNERAKELYQLGFFNPANADSSLMALDMMDFEGIEKIKQKISENGTLYQQVVQLQQLLMKYQSALGIGTPMQSSKTPVNQVSDVKRTNSDEEAKGSSTGIASASKEAQTPMTSYGERLAKRSAPDMSAR